MLLVHFALGAVAFWTVRRTKNIVQRAVKAIALQQSKQSHYKSRVHEVGLHILQNEGEFELV
jgi:hypothetical protein